VQLFNQLLLRRECCSFSNGEYVKTGLAEVENWIHAAGKEWVGESWDELRYIRQVGWPSRPKPNPIPNPPSLSCSQWHMARHLPLRRTAAGSPQRRGWKSRTRPRAATCA
jgi:hypothetical protein